MTVYFALIKRGFQRQMRYRASMFAGLATNFFWGLLRATIFVALFGTQLQVNGVSLQDAITFTALSQALIAFFSLFGWYELMQSVYTGDVASDLLKPVSYFKYWMAKDFGRSMANFLSRGITIMLAYLLFIKLTLPTSVGQWINLSIVILLAWVISFCIRFLINLTSFWIPNARGVGRILFFSSLFFSGFLMPLRFFPDWVTNIANFTPFPYTINIVFETFIGLHTEQDIYNIYTSQIGWIIIMLILIAITLKAGVKKLVIQGG